RQGRVSGFVVRGCHSVAIGVSGIGHFSPFFPDRLPVRIAAERCCRRHEPSGAHFRSLVGGRGGKFVISFSMVSRLISPANRTLFPWFASRNPFTTSTTGRYLASLWAFCCASVRRRRRPPVPLSVSFLATSSLSALKVN